MSVKSTDDTTAKDTAAKKDAPKIEERGDVVTENKTDRERQIERANAVMEKKSDESSEGAQVLAKQQDDEEAKYAGHADLPPTSGKAIDTATPTIGKDGTKHWNGGVQG